MNCEKPKDIAEYIEWVRDKHKIEITARTKAYYDSVAIRVKTDFEKSALWTELTENLREYDSEYYLKYGYHLLAELTPPELDVKPFNSFLLKNLRKNVLENENWPAKPKGGWILPNNWFSEINDIVRTLLVVKYMDGIEFMIGKIDCLCANHGLTCEVSLEAKEEGYYAAHLYTRPEFEIPQPTWDTQRTTVPIEIQITTQLQEVIRQLLHKYYEETRKRPREDVEGKKWQWNYKSDEFIANYLGHILHYVGGMIMEVRERQEGAKP